MARKVIAVEIEEQVKPLLDQIEWYAAEQQTPLTGAAQYSRLAPAFEAAQEFLNGDFKPLE